MSNGQQELSSLMETAMLLAVAAAMDGMTKVVSTPEQNLTSWMETIMIVSMVKIFVEPALETVVGHPVTAWDWWCYQEKQEKKRRAEAYAACQGQALAPWNNLRAQLQQMAEDERKIENFVRRQK